MSEVKMPEVLDLPSNSISKKESTDQSDTKPKIKKIVTGKVVSKKKSFGSKFKEVFFGEEVGNVKGYILQDVLIPTIKDTISDIIIGSVEMALFGERRFRSGKSKNNSYVSYSNYSYNRNSSKKSSENISSRNLQYGVNDIILESRGEAEDVLGNMIDIIKDYGVVSVADLYEMVDIPGAFTDNDWGWFDLSRADVRKVREGYLLVLPRVKCLK